MRNRFDEQLAQLDREMIEMGAMCEEAIAMAVKALAEGDTALARRVRDEGGEIDRMERDIESRCMKLLLHQQPVARDLRQISAALKMITDLERIGDQAEDLAGIALYLNGRPLQYVATLTHMALGAVQMVTAAVDAFVKKDVAGAEAVLRQDDDIDSSFATMKREILQIISGNPADGEFALDLLMISKYLERIADHATNLAEWVIYAVSGVHKEEEA